MPTLHAHMLPVLKPQNLDKGIQTIRNSRDITPIDPVQVGNERQLLMDWHVVDDINGAVRKVHQPEKCADNPVIAPEHKYEGTGLASFGTVMRDSQTGKFRAWVPAFEHFERRKAKGRSCATGNYYESDDGLSWDRPNVGLIERHGNKDNNIVVMSYTDNLSVFELPERMRDRGRFAMSYCDCLVGDDAKFIENPERSHGMRMFLAFSEDGMRFEQAPENPIWVGRTDCNNCIVYNAQRDVFMYYRRATINAGEIRRIAYSESKDLITWTQPINIIRREENDPLYIYSLAVSHYHGVYLGMLMLLHAHPDGKNNRLPDGRDHQMNTELVWSRDGVNWERHPLKPIFIDTSSNHRGALDWGMAMGMNNVIEMDDHVRVYYGGRECLHGGNLLASDPMRSTICLSTLRRDGFVSISADDNGGMMLTKPLAYPGGKLHINAKTADNGFIRIAVREGEGVRDGEWAKAFLFDQTVPFTGDSLDHVVTWQNTELDAFPGKTLRLHVWLENADLYSFSFE